MDITIQARNGERCSGESHRFRIGVDARSVTEFSTAEGGFADALTNAMIDHVSGRKVGNPGVGWFLQVWCGGGAGWRNLQNEDGGVVRVGHQVVGDSARMGQLWACACNSVQMARDISVISQGLSGEVE